MRNVFGDTFYELARQDERLMMVVADISPAAAMTQFRENYPQRFVNVGVSEQIMVSMCAGLYLKGMRPFAYTIATFVLYRTFEFWRDDLAYQKLPVTLVGIGGGVNYVTLGGTHHAMEDVAVASAVPNMQVLVPCDPAEVKSATQWCATENDAGPVYLRLGRAGEPVLTEGAEPFQFGKLRYLRLGTKIGFLSYGVILNAVMTAAKKVEEKCQHPVSVVNCHTLKPLDVQGILEFLSQHECVVIVEEHVPQGGLMNQVKAIAWDNRLSCRLKALTLQDHFLHVYGSHSDLLAAHGVGVEQMIAAAIS